tara:strand:+ start:415 stop:609 length:195 start_codon:yes stop_codon:yes gene_type:complete
MRPETRKSMEMLFHAKWNLPTAAKHCNLTTKEMKITFNEYCQFHPQDVPTELAKTFKEGSEEAS